LAKITNDKIREIMKVETTIVEEIQRRQLMWRGWKILEYLSRSSNGRRQKRGKEEDLGRHGPAE